MVADGLLAKPFGGDSNRADSELCRSGGMAAVVAGTVGVPVGITLAAATRPQDLAHDRQVVTLAVGTHQVDLAHAAAPRSPSFHSHVSKERSPHASSSGHSGFFRVS